MEISETIDRIVEENYQGYFNEADAVLIKALMRISAIQGYDMGARNTFRQAEEILDRTLEKLNGTR